MGDFQRGHITLIYHSLPKNAHYIEPLQHTDRENPNINIKTTSIQFVNF